jgi:transcriptional antiterminator
MAWWIFGKKGDNDLDELKDGIKNSFSAVKDDLKKTANWIKHLNSRSIEHDGAIETLFMRLSTAENEISELKSFISFFGNRGFKQPFKQGQTAVDKQTAVQGVQTAVQTAVQTGVMRGLSAMERAIVWVLLNTDMKLSYEDVAALMGKDKATIRGQINSIRQKSEGLVEEIIERNGKKRVFIPDEMKAILLKTIKTSIRPEKRGK